VNTPLPPFACPLPAGPEQDRVTLAHGEGGRLSRRLIEEHILPILGNEFLAPLGDSAALPHLSGAMAFTTDSFVVSPLFFPGGDIGSLAVFGTVNDLAVAGARPQWLSVALIIEEGTPFAVLAQVLHSIAAAARRAQVRVVAGDTKVVPRGAADGLFITTSGIGELIPPVPPGPASLEPGDELIVSGPIGRHGISILAARENLGFDPPPMSDCGPLVLAVEVLRQAQIPIRSMRDATRGGVAAVLHEWAQASGHTLTVSEASFPVSSEVRGACELLGLDPLHLAGEGTLLLCTPAGFSEAAVEAFRRLPETRSAARIGAVRPRGAAAATVRRILGTEQPLDDPMGIPLPRIC
jgi:hydrogenase expression/formation protein HypE